jgi:hypothetical protein
VVEPVAFHGGCVFDQSDGGGQRRHQASSGVVFRQAAEFAADHLAVVVQKSLQDLPFSSGADQIFIGKGRAGRHIGIVPRRAGWHSMGEFPGDPPHRKSK